MQPIFRILYAGDYWVGNVVFRTGQVLHIPGVREELLRLAAAGKSEERHWAIVTLGNAKGDAEVSERLLPLFRNAAEDTGTRCCALGALCELRPDLAKQLIVEALRDPRIRRLSGWAWWFAFKGGHVPPLDLCLAGLGPDVAPNGRHMAGLLARHHGQPGIQALEEAMHCSSPVKQEAAAVALADRVHPEAFDVLVRALQRGGHERKWGRIIARHVVQNYARRLIEWVEAARGLATSVACPATPDLSESPELAWAAAQARLAMGTATPADLIHQGPPTLQADALRQMVAESGAAALPELRRCLAEGTPKKVARAAFWQMHDLREAAEPAALEMLESPLWTERKAAVCLLRRWGKLGVEQKARAAADPHLAVRHAANWHPSHIEAARSGHPKWAKKTGPHQA
jgi:hypothetical protein